MLLAIDAGNTNVVVAVHDGRDIIHSWRCKTDAGRTADEYAAWLHQLFTIAGLSFHDITGTVISSVVPDANFNLSKFCRDCFHSDPLIVNNQLDLGIEIKINNPREMGADRLLHAMAIKAHYHYPAIVVDFGTSTTYDVIDETGAHCGGVISPGVNLSMAALHEAAAKLPKICIARPASVIGRDTVTAMQSGVYWGVVGAVEGLIARLSAEMGVKPFVIATGGLSPLFAGATDMIQAHDENLTMKGLIACYHHLTKDVKAA